MPIPVIAELVPQNNAPFPVVDDTNIRGGYQILPNQDAINAIPQSKRKEGMQAFSQDTSVLYTLGTDLVTWTVTMVPNSSVPTTVFNQIISSATWSIGHNLNKFPSVTVTDSIDRIIVGDVSYVDANNITISFTAPFSGQVFLN